MSSQRLNGITLLSRLPNHSKTAFLQPDESSGNGNQGMVKIRLVDCADGGCNYWIHPLTGFLKVIPLFQYLQAHLRLRTGCDYRAVRGEKPIALKAIQSVNAEGGGGN